VHDSARPHAVDVDPCWQAPATQTPVLPHGGLATQFGGSAVRSGTFAQVPAPLTLHDWQAGQLEVVQQTPSVQLPLPHSLAAPHDLPLAFLATQLPAVVALPLQ
jgi:hypothetical protein